MTNPTNIQTQPNPADRGKELAEIFQDDDRKYSTMRAMSFIALIAAIVFGGLGMTDKDSDAKYFTTVFLVAAFAPKAVQKFAERM
ncbi:MAG: hypothetical protein MUE44_17335 [Oscillatoriaceae cyanobacterium Prado104]|jgi:hypothetical protein|nr:hypothetical protein [Oscillatoriaceae cyanobacterium Prado104]